MKPWQKQLGILAMVKIAYVLCVCAIIFLFPANKNSEMGQVAHIVWTSNGHPTFESYFTTWDAAHYLYLAENGYQAGHETCAFFPLWPFSIRCLSALTRSDLIVSGMILTNVFSLAGLFIFFRIVSRRFGERVAWNSVTLLLAFPGALFFQFIYSESLFFLLIMLLCYGLDSNRFAISALAGFLIPFTRAVGIFCVFPVAFLLIKRIIDKFPLQLKSRFSEKDRPQEPAVTDYPQRHFANATLWPNVVGYGWVLMLTVGGWIAYLLLMREWTGNAFAGFDAQRHWGVHSVGNIFNVTKFVEAFFHPTRWHAFTGSVLDRCAFLLLLDCLPLVWRLNKVWFVWAIVLGVVPAMSGHFTSFIRFEAIVFPMFVALAVYFNQADKSKRWLFMFTTIAFASLHLILLWRFLFFMWAG